MIHYGAAGAFGGPRQERKEPDADCFRIGDEWRSPSGAVHRVVRSGGRTVMLLNTGTGKTQTRPWDAIGAHSSRPWVRVFSGA
jgi:hypothetical protein